MKNQTNATLWIDPIQPGSFRIPDDQALPTGACRIYALTGAHRQVDPAALAACAITEDTARMHLQAAVAQMRTQTTTAVAALRHVAGIPVPGFTDAPPGDHPPLNLDRLAALLRITPAQVHTDPAAVTQGLRDLVTEVDAVIAAAIADDPSQRATARDRLRFLRVRLQAAGIVVDETRDDLIDQITAVLQGRQSHHAGALATILQHIAAPLEQSPDAGGRQIDAAIADVEQPFGAVLASERPDARQARKRQEYRQAAQSATARTLQDRGLTPARRGAPALEPDRDHAEGE
jgi:hypothetical protein